MTSSRAQATVETVLLVPFVIACALGGWQVLMVGWALVSAGDAAHVGARAILSREPARPAVRRALPGSMRSGAQITIGESRITVSVSVPSVIPGYAPRISESASVVRQ